MLLESYNCNSRRFVSCKSIVFSSFTCKGKKGRKPLIDYNKSLIIISNEYANILHEKVKDKKVIKEIRK
jgi:hypothetical protein